MPLIVFSGDDHYSIRRATRAVIDRGGFEAFDVERITAVGTSPQSVLMTIGTAGLFAQKRLVILEGMGQEKKATSRSKVKSDEPPQMALQDLIDAAPETTTVLALLTGLRADSKLIKEAAKLFKEKAIRYQQFASPKARDMGAWLSQLAKSTGVRLDARAAQQLAARVGEQPAVVAMELEKLATAAGPDGVISVELVEALVAKTAEDSIFPLIDAVSLRQTDKAFDLLARQFDQAAGSDDPRFRILPLIARQLRMLLSIKLMTSEGRSRDEIVAELKIPEYFADRYFSQAVRLTKTEIESGIQRLAATDQSLKNGDAGPAVLQLLIADLTKPIGARL